MHKGNWSQAVKFYGYLYINKRHTKIEKYALIVLTRLVCMITGSSSSIYSHICSEVASDKFKLAIRRLFWLLKNGRVRLDIISDPYFDFSIGLSTNAAVAAYGFLEKRRQSESNFETHLICAQIASAVIESQIDVGEKKYLSELEFSEFDSLFESHFAAATSLLSAQAESTRISGESRKSGQSKVRDSKNLLMKHASSVFKLVMKSMNENEKTCFVISGTFLGLIREQGFITHDYDIDLGLFEEEVDQRLLDTLSKLDGFKEPELDYPCFRNADHSGAIFYSRVCVPALMKLMHKSGVQVDIFTHYRDGDSYWHGSSLHRWDNKIFELKKRDFLGQQVWSPKDYEVYLTENYGDWRTPVAKFNCSVDTPNIGQNNSCKNMCYQLRLKWDGRKQ